MAHVVESQWRSPTLVSHTNSPISEDVSQAEDFVIPQRVEVEEVGDVDVLHTELVWLAAVMSTACLVIVDLNALHLEAYVPVLNASVELCIAINVIDGSDVMCNK